MEEEINREEVYTLSYINREDGRQITASFHPLGDTWEGVLPEIRSFLQGVGFEFRPNDVLTFIDAREAGLSISLDLQSKLDRAENDKSGYWLEGYSDGFAEAIKLIQQNVPQLLTFADARILNNYLKSMKAPDEDN